jgi:hypothetical protein
MSVNQSLVRNASTMLDSVETAIASLSQLTGDQRHDKISFVHDSLGKAERLILSNKDADSTSGLDVALAVTRRPKEMDLSGLPEAVRALAPPPRQTQAISQEEVRKAHLDSVRNEYGKLERRLQELRTRFESAKR